MISSKLKKYSLWFLLLLLAAFLVKEAFSNGDFKVFLEAAKLISHGENPYNKWIFVSEDNYFFYYYSPLWAIILIPFTYFPNFIPNVIWLFLNAFFLYRIWILLSSYFESLTLTRKQVIWILVLSIALSFRFVLYNISLIQMTIFLLWGILESLRLINKERIVKGSLLLALIINIKIMPVVIIPYLIYRGHFKAFVFTLIFSLTCLFLPAIFVGWSFNISLLHEWWNVINPTNSEHLFETGLSGHGLTSLIPPLLTETEGELFYPRNIMNLSIENSTLILNAVRLILISSTLLILKWPPFKNTQSQIHRLQEISFILLLIPLIFPHQQKYAFVLAIPAQVYLLYFIFHNYSSRLLVIGKVRRILILASLILSFALMTLTTDGLIGRELNNITQHYKTVTYGALLLLFTLFLSSSNFIEKTLTNKNLID